MPEREAKGSYFLGKAMTDRVAFFIASVLVNIAMIPNRMDLFANAQSETDLDPKRSLVWGPGIDPRSLDLPVRYFFVQLVNNKGENVTDVENDLLSASVDKDEGRGIHVEVVDNRYGMYIVRYRLRTPTRSLRIVLRLKDGRPVAQSPYIFKREKGFNPEGCYCPRRSVKEWTELAQCPRPSRQIRLDLSTWQRGTVNFTDALHSAQQRWASRPGAHSFCHYIFLNNEIYRKCYGEHVGFKMFSDAVLLSLTRKAHLPDTEFLMNLGDWPLESRRLDEAPAPLISWCGSERTRDILLPTYEMTESILEMLGRQSLDVQSVQSLRSTRWENKKDMAFFRGRDSRQERLDLVLLSRRHPDLLEAGITHFFFFRDEMDVYGPTVPSVSFEHFFRFRYQLNVDGTVAAYRLAYLLAGDALVLKQDSPYYEHYYKELRPWVHFVPLLRNLSDLEDKISWARAHPIQVQEIISHAQDFVMKHLQPMNIFCYHMQLFDAYSWLLTSAPTSVPADMESVPQPSLSFNCLCASDSPSSTDKREL